MQGKLVVLGLVVYCLQALGAPSPEGKDGSKDRSSIPPGAESQPAIHVGKNSALAARRRREDVSPTELFRFQVLMWPAWAELDFAVQL
ncbi:hypothetical protein MHUMG1_01342 [Metarhizium humberi]|uniref:Uncharacterized protein n=1 Tax=Metarhizium humberi TaxID=2596975 RepID=A0A9P8SA32_9HYPO|nr:hypothetical protein MHUMG1_01342 [Metarhizium humberi]